MTACLASVRDVTEANLVADAGVPWIDLKEPSAGALGAVPVAVMRSVASTWRGRRTLSATIGDCWEQLPEIAPRVQAVAAAGLDFAKVGLFAHRPSPALLAALAGACDAPCGVIAVCFAESPPDAEDIAALASTGLAGLMLDTANKGGPGLCELMLPAALRTFVAEVKARGLLCGLAGRLALADLPGLLPLGADYLGFRGALCAGRGREAAIDPNAARQLLMSFGTASPHLADGASLQRGQ